MNAKLKLITVAAATALLGGIVTEVFIPVPATRRLVELRDAGLTEGQRFVRSCPERLTRQTWRRVERNQPGFLRRNQMVARIARIAFCYPRDGGVRCWRPATWEPLVGDHEADVIVPSMRADLVGIDLDASVGNEDDAGDSEDVDDAMGFDLARCVATKCADYDAGGLGLPWDNVCGGANRVWAETPPCVMPMCWFDDAGVVDIYTPGTWDKRAGKPGHPAAPDCDGVGPLGLADGGRRWHGCGTMAGWAATGTQCLPVECGVVAGDDPIQVLGGL